jgi:hypothetical protein
MINHCLVILFEQVVCTVQLRPKVRSLSALCSAPRAAKGSLAIDALISFFCAVGVNAALEMRPQTQLHKQ